MLDSQDKPIADETRKMLPFGSPKRGRVARPNEAKRRRRRVVQADPPHGGTDARVPRRGRWRGSVSAPASRVLGRPGIAGLHPAAGRASRGPLNGFPGALAGALRQRGGACHEWHAKARSAGLTLSDLVRRSVGRVRPAATPSTPNTAGAGRMTRNGPEWSNPGIAPTSRRLRAGLGLEAEPRDLIRDYLLQRVEHGAVRNRADVVAVLREAGLEGAAPGRPGQRRTGSTHGAEGDGIRTHAGRCPHDLSRRPSPTVNDHTSLPTRNPSPDLETLVFEGRTHALGPRSMCVAHQSA